ncbi:MAG: energy transducer TonB [Bacteroidales bacterium]|nr:energy transducer TonB [Bacteroidales bacterium]
MVKFVFYVTGLFFVSCLNIKPLSDNKTNIAIHQAFNSASMEPDLHFTLHVDSTRLSDPKYREFLCIQRRINNEELVHYFPSLPIFDGDLDLFIRDNIRYPEHLRNQNLNESVLVYLEVDTEGNTFNHQVIRSSQYDELNKEALRVTRLVKFDKPSEDIEKPGEPVYTTYYIRVPFHK